MHYQISLVYQSTQRTKLVVDHSNLFVSLKETQLRSIHIYLNFFIQQKIIKIHITQIQNKVVSFSCIY